MEKRALSRRDFLRLSAVAGTGVILVACAPKVVEKTVRETVVVEKPVEKIVKETVIVEKPVEKVITAAPVERIKLKFYYAAGRQATEVPVYEEVIEQFEKERPEIEIEFSPIPWSNYWTKVLTDISAGYPPDVIFMGSSRFPQFMGEGYIMDLTPFIEADPEVKLDDLFETEREAFSTEDGRLGAFPEMFNVGILAYNKDMFDTAGLDYPDEDWTWDDLLQVAKQLTKDENGDGTPEVHGVAVNGASWSQLAPLIYQTGGKFFTKDKDKSILSEDGAIDTFRFLTELYTQKLAPLPAELKEADATTRFVTGQTALAYVRTNMRLFGKDITFNWDITLKPKHPGTGLSLTELAPRAQAVVAATEHPQEAYEFMKYMIQNGAYRVCERGDYLPALRGAVQKIIETESAPPANKQIYMKASETAVNMPTHPIWWEIWKKAYTPYMELMYLGEMSVDEAVAKMDEEANKLIAASE